LSFCEDGARNGIDPEGLVRCGPSGWLPLYAAAMVHSARPAAPETCGGAGCALRAASWGLRARRMRMPPPPPTPPLVLSGHAASLTPY